MSAFGGKADIMVGGLATTGLDRCCESFLRFSKPA